MRRVSPRFFPVSSPFLNRIYRMYRFSPVSHPLLPRISRSQKGSRFWSGYWRCYDDSTVTGVFIQTRPVRAPDRTSFPLLPVLARISRSFPASHPLQSFLNRFSHASAVRHAAPFLLIRTHVPVLARFSHVSHPHFPFTNNILDFGAGNT